MTINDWWWTGFNNALQGNYFPPKVSFFKRRSYAIGWTIGKFLRFGDFRS